MPILSVVPCIGVLVTVMAVSPARYREGRTSTGRLTSWLLLQTGFGRWHAATLTGPASWPVEQRFKCSLRLTVIT